MKRKEIIEHLKNSEMGELLFERVEYQSQLIDSYITKHVI